LHHASNLYCKPIFTFLYFHSPPFAIISISCTSKVQNPFYNQNYHVFVSVRKTKFLLQLWFTNTYFKIGGNSFLMSLLQLSQTSLRFSFIIYFIQTLQPTWERTKYIVSCVWTTFYVFVTYKKIFFSHHEFKILDHN